MKRIRVSAAAARALDRIWLYVASNSTMEIASQVIESITGTFPLFARTPEAGTRPG